MRDPSLSWGLGTGDWAVEPQSHRRPHHHNWCIRLLFAEGIAGTPPDYIPSGELLLLLTAVSTHVPKNKHRKRAKEPEHQLSCAYLLLDRWMDARPGEDQQESKNVI